MELIYNKRSLEHEMGMHPENKNRLIFIKDAKSIKLLKNVFEPKSIAVIGASNNKSSVGYGVMKNLTSGGYKGKVFPVNNKRAKILDKKCFKKLLDIKEEVDLVIIATPVLTVLGLVKECSRKKVKAVVIMSSGFNEAGKEGEALSKKILHEAKKTKMRIIGPNCMGFIKTSLNLNATFSNQRPKKGKIAFISQSGALGSSTLDWAEKNKIGFSFFASLGAMIDVGFSDLINYLGNDPETESIVIYMESLTHAKEFMSAARAFSKNKPIIVIKAGKSSEGAKAALSHTGTLAGNDDVFNAAFKRTGIVRVSEIEEFFDCVKTLSKQNLPKGNKLAIITNAGGPGVIATDKLMEKKGEVAKLSYKTINELNKQLPKAWSKRNPIDLLGDAGAKEYKAALESCIKEENVDGILLILTPQSMTNDGEIAKEILKLEKTDKPILASFMGGKGVEKGREILEKGGIPTFESPERAIKAFMYLDECSRNLKALYQKSKTIPHAFNPKTKENKELLNSIISQKRYILTEKESKDFLANYYIPISKSEIAKNMDEAKKIAKKIGFPLAMKISSPDILHKTDIQGVVLNISNNNELEKKYKELIKNVKKNSPKSVIYGVLIEKMINKKYELILGCKKDSIFGHSIVFGRGGTAVEIFKDISIGIPPLNMELAEKLVDETKISKLLKGYRGDKPIDIKDLHFLLCKFSHLIVDFPEIKDIDINPYSIDDEGGFVVDAKIILDKEYILKKKILRPIKPEDDSLEK